MQNMSQLEGCEFGPLSTAWSVGNARFVGPSHSIKQDLTLDMIVVPCGHKYQPWCHHIIPTPRAPLSSRYTISSCLVSVMCVILNYLVKTTLMIRKMLIVRITTKERNQWHEAQCFLTGLLLLDKYSFRCCSIYERKIHCNIGFKMENTPRTRIW